MSAILIVEDDQSIAQMYEFKLLQAGYEIRVAHNGADGLISAEQNPPALILLDLRMPIMSGDDMLQELRATEWGQDIQVIILTNISRSEAPAKLQFLGVDRYIVKAHHTPQQVLEIVREVLR